jgi:hypothetical protein
MAPFAISGIFECRVAILKIRILVLKNAASSQVEMPRIAERF